MSHHKVSACINGGMCQCGLIAVRGGFFFVAPVEVDNDQICTFFFYFIDICYQLSPAFQVCIQLIDTDQAYFNAFDVDDSRLVISKCSDAGIFQSVLSIRIALGTIVTGMVVGKVCSLHRTGSQDGSILRISLERVLFVGSCLGGSQSTFEIDDGKIILFQIRLHILEEIIGTVQRIIGVQTCIGVKIFICSKCTVTHQADGDAGLGCQCILWRSSFRGSGLGGSLRGYFVLACVWLDCRNFVKSQKQKDKSNAGKDTEKCDIQIKLALPVSVFFP